MDYEKLYKEAIKKAKDLHDNHPYEESPTWIICEKIFPELKEIGDEKTKNWILKYLYDGLQKSDEQFKDQFNTAIAWLEKQELKKIDNEWVDLGLPSGTLWKSTNEDGYFSYDEAVITFGDQLPTKKQFEELIDNCFWEWKENGYKVTGPNRNSIFLTALGYRYRNGNTFFVGTHGYYWSSTHNGSKNAWCFHLNSSKVNMYNDTLYCWFSICLVKNK